MKVARMSRVERRQLIRLGRRSHDPYTSLRFQAVAKLGAGRSTPQVAVELDVAISTVVRAADHFLADGIAGLYDRRRGNGACKADDRFDRVLTRLLRSTPEDFGWERFTWTRELLCLQMKLEGFPPVAVCTMGRALSRIGARLGTPKPSSCAHGHVNAGCVFWLGFADSKHVRALKSPFCTPTRSTFTSTPRSVATGCCAAISVAS
jgi:transposase